MTSESKMAEIELGDHLCMIYDDEREKLYTEILFIVDGLKNDELVILLNEDEEELISVLSQIVDVRRFLDKKQLIFLSKDESYLRDGFFDVDRMLEDIAELDEKALAEGYKGLRLVGDASWVLSYPKAERFLEFETKLNKLLPLTRCIVLCLFDERKFNPDFLLKALQVHPKLIAGKEVKENLNYVPPEVLFKNRKLEREFEEMEEKFKMLFESPFKAVIIFKGERVVSCNPKAMEILGIKNFRQVIGKSVYDFFGYEIKNRIEAAKAEPQFFELSLSRDGRKIELEASLTKVSDKLMMIARDITERKEMERKLKESEEMFKKLAEKSPVGIYLIQDEVFKYVNPKMAELWGYSVEELIGKTWMDFVHPDDRETVRKNIERRIEDDIESTNYKLRIIRKDGEVRINEVFGSRIIYNGKPAIIGTLIDITEEENLRRKLEEHERFYQDAQDIFFILDIKGRLLDVNPKYAEMLGYTKEELIGHTPRKLIDPSDLDRIRENFRKVLQGQSVRCEAKVVAKDGRVYVMDVSIWPVFKDGEIVGAEGISRDITESVRLNKLLNAINNIRKIIVHEKNKLKLINKALKELMDLSYFTCWIGMVENDSLITTSEILKTIDLRNYGEVNRNANCMIKAMEEKEVIFREGEDVDCKECEFYEKPIELKKYAIPMIVDGKAYGGIVVYSETSLIENEFEMLKTLANDLAFALKSIELENEMTRALEQIEKNIENYAILVDHIRNPLAIISGVAEIRLENMKEEKDIILRSVKKIENVIEKLERGWLESEAIRRFLKKYNG
jgi:PAS domain S-box-containing protein